MSAFDDDLSAQMNSPIAITHVDIMISAAAYKTNSRMLFLLMCVIYMLYLLEFADVA